MVGAECVLPFAAFITAGQWPITRASEKLGNLQGGRFCRQPLRPNG